MSTTLHSFMDIFESDIIADGQAMHLNKIVIPPIQRDYAQGRLDGEIGRVRSRFLVSLYDAVVRQPITLDFIYGDIDEDGTMTPLDGQQRLTTLFLLHWYAAKKENISAEEYAFLEHFSYETRYSARYFCEELIKFNPAFTDKISEEIINQAWFPLDWKKDPTISSMLVMLDAIDETFRNVQGIWGRLKNQAITFYFLPVRDMALTDELYIKMNSRGKPLTLFEHFKAELEREIRKLDEKTGHKDTDRIIEKIDRKWTDLLWSYRDGDFDNPEDDLVDDEFLRYFWFICDMICYRSGESPQNYSSDVFDLLNRYFSADNSRIPENLATLEAFFDCWCDIAGFSSPTEFLESFMSDGHEPGKIRIFSGKVDIFEDCIHAYGNKSGKLRQFPLNRSVLLYAIIIYLQHQEEVTREEFIRRIRIVNNLIQNSEDEVSDRIDRNRIPAILKAVDALMLTGRINETEEKNFNESQIREETEKIEFLTNHPNAAESLYRLEDHNMLRGQISIIGLEHLEFEPRFASLFCCDWDKVDCALMATGNTVMGNAETKNYGQRERNKWRYQYGSSNKQQAWHELFHRSGNDGFDNTREILLRLLAVTETFDDSILDDLILTFTKKCENAGVYPWEYYYVKYPVFRPGSFGKLSNNDAESQPYMFSVMQTKSQWSLNTYMPWLKESDELHLSRDHMGQRLIYEDVYIICENASYVVCRIEDDTEADRINICQNVDGLDTEDRIIKLKNILKACLSLTVEDLNGKNNYNKGNRKCIGQTGLCCFVDAFEIKGYELR